MGNERLSLPIFSFSYSFFLFVDIEDMILSPVAMVLDKIIIKGIANSNYLHFPTFS